MKYLAKYDGRSITISTKNVLEGIINDLKKLNHIDISIEQIVSEMKGMERFIYKILGLKTDIFGWSVYLLSSECLAILVFLDEDHNEYRVVNKENHNIDDSNIEFVLQTGEKSIHSIRECISLEMAFEAILYFYEKGKKPNWLQYKKVT